MRCWRAGTGTWPGGLLAVGARGWEAGGGAGLLHGWGSRLCGPAGSRRSMRAPLLLRAKLLPSAVAAARSARWGRRPARPPAQSACPARPRKKALRRPSCAPLLTLPGACKRESAATGDPARRYETAEARFRDSGEQPVERLGCCGLVGRRVNALSYHAEQVRALNPRPPPPPPPPLPAPRLAARAALPVGGPAAGWASDRCCGDAEVRGQDGGELVAAALAQRWQPWWRCTGHWAV
jgi:hypothetical protein